MAKLYIFLILIFITVIGLFAVENKEPIILKIPFSSYYEMSKIALILISISFGAFFIFIVFFIRDTAGLINKIQIQKRHKKEEKIKEYYAKALNAIMRDKTSEAKEALQEILNEEPEHIDALIRLGDIAIKEEDFKTALKYYKKAYEFDPKNIIPLLSLEDMMEKMNDNELALKYIDQILSLEPDNLLAHYKMRNILEKMEKWEKLINIQKKIIKMVSNSKKLEEENKLIGYSYEYGRVNLEQGNLENAERIFSTLIKSHPNFIPSYLGMVEVLISKGELEEAINLIEKAYFEHKSKIFLIRLEDLLISIGNPKKLIQFYIKAINESPNDNELKMLLGRLYYRLEMIDDAIDILDSIDTAAYTNPKLYCIKGYLYLRRNQTLKALSSFKELCPENRISSINYSCKVCKSQFEEWTGRCSKCGSWNSFQIDFRGCEFIK